MGRGRLLLAAGLTGALLTLLAGVYVSAAGAWAPGAALSGVVGTAPTATGLRALARPQVGMVSFANAKHGWASGPMGSLLHTTDGGKHWKRQYFRDRWLDDQSSYRVEALSSKVCWAVAAGGGIYRTTNAGKTWVRTARKMRPSNQSGNSWAYIEFVSKRGWIVSSCGDIIGTGNGGSTWTWQRRATGGSDSVRGISAANAGHAFVALNAVGGHYVLATSDGRTWSQVGPRPFLSWNPDFSGIWAENSTRVWVAARLGEVFLSEDGGQTWRVSNTGVGPGQLVVNDLDGYGTTICAVGSPAAGSVTSGAALRSDSDGLSWSWASFPSGAKAPGTVSSIEWASEKTGWIVASGGAIYRTQDGGGTWQKQY
jgi:photosystem II stability/assembly factor-like uncharacterized protein